MNCTEPRLEVRVMDQEARSVAQGCLLGEGAGPIPGGENLISKGKVVPRPPIGCWDSARQRW
jgi:hypothetical protein